MFDPEERHLELALAVEPLLLEAARRADHWRLIRTALPSDGLHFIAEPSAQRSCQHVVREVVQPASHHETDQFGRLGDTRILGLPGV